MTKIKTLFYLKKLTDIIKVLAISCFLGLVFTYVLKQTSFDINLIRYTILGIFSIFMLIMVICIYVLTNYDLILRSSRIIILGIALFLTTDLLIWQDKAFNNLIAWLLPIAIGLGTISIIYGLLYSNLIEKEVFDKALLTEGYVNIDTTTLETTKQSLQESVAKWIEPKYKGKVGIITKGIVPHKKGHRKAVLYINLVDNKHTEKLFELPIDIY